MPFVLIFKKFLNFTDTLNVDENLFPLFLPGAGTTSGLTGTFWEAVRAGKITPPKGYIRPPLSKKLFPVRRVTAKKASWEVGNFSFFTVFNFSLTRMYQED